MKSIIVNETLQAGFPAPRPSSPLPDLLPGDLQSSYKRGMMGTAFRQFFHVQPLTICAMTHIVGQMVCLLCISIKMERRYVPDGPPQESKIKQSW
jgi:hypothetical protein